jgi:hypothetical protein
MERRETYFRCAEDQDRPSGFDDGLALPCGFLYFLDFGKCPVHRRSEVIVNVAQIFHNPYLIPVTTINVHVSTKKAEASWSNTRKKRSHLLVVHRAKDRPF